MRYVFLGGSKKADTPLLHARCRLGVTPRHTHRLRGGGRYKQRVATVELRRPSSRPLMRARGGDKPAVRGQPARAFCSSTRPETCPRSPKSRPAASQPRRAMTSRQAHQNVCLQQGVVLHSTHNKSVSVMQADRVYAFITGPKAYPLLLHSQNVSFQ